MGNPMLDELVAKGAFRQTISLPRRRDRFHIMATSVGRETAEHSPYDWDGRRRGSTPFSVIQHTISGTGRLRYEQHSWVIQPGETMLVTIPHAHRYWLEPGERWEFFWIATTGQEALRLHRAVLKAVGPVFRLKRETVDELAGLSLSLASAGLKAGRASSYAYQATMALHDDLMERHAAGSGDGARTDLARAKAYALDHLDEPLDVGTLARVAGMSRGHFSRSFAHAEGVPPSEFLIQQRMLLAARLLVGGQLSVKAVASACGFDDPNYFAKVFRRVFAISPTQFRTNGMYAAL